MKKYIVGLMMIMLAGCCAGCGSNDNKESLNSSQNSEVEDKELAEVLNSVEEYDVEKIVTLGEYKNVVVNTYVSDEEVDKEIENVVAENPLYEEVKDREVKEGDTVNIDFVGKKDGVEFDGGKGEKFDLVIGSGSFIEGFEEGLIGTKPGDVVDLNLTFPKEYQNSPELAGQDVVFTVTVNYIKGEAIETKFDDEFVKRVSNGEQKTTDEYREYIKNNLYTSNVSGMVDTAYMQILEASTVSEVPQGLVEVMKLRIDASYKMMSKDQGYTDFEEFIKMFAQISLDEYNNKLDETAKTYVEQQLITEAIAKKENITITDEEYEKYLNNYLENNNVESVEEMEKITLENYKSDLKSLINEAILLDKVFALIGESVVEVSDKPEE